MRIKQLRHRFDGFLPIVVDLETGGCIAATDALLEIAAVTLRYNDGGYLELDTTFACQVEPFAGARIDPQSLVITGIDVRRPFRFALSEMQAIQQLFHFVQKNVQREQCRRAILVGHNAHFDLDFLQAAAERCQLKKQNPFHSFTCFDTATLSALTYKITVLARAVRAAGFEFDQSQAHSAIYDAECTAQLFCRIINQWDRR